MTHPLLEARRGAALIIALLLLVVLDCIVLGTLHISLQEHRIGANREVMLQLRLDAESAVRRAAGPWSVAIDTMQTGGNRVAVATAGMGSAVVEVERLGDRLFLFEGVAREAAPRVGRAAVRLLMRPPALPPGVDPATAPVSAVGQVRILETGVVSALAPPDCPKPPAAHAILTTDPAAVLAVPGSRIGAPAGSLEAGSLMDRLDRVASLSADREEVQQLAADTVLTGAHAGVLIVAGGVVLSTGAAVRGLLIARGAVVVEAGALMTGALHTGAGLTSAGEIRWDPCLVESAVAAARLRTPAPADPRPWLPVF